MITAGTTIHTATGATVTIRRRGIGFDLETRNARGETISTVVMSEDDVRALLDEIEGESGITGESCDEGYKDGYDEGYKDGYDEGYKDGEAA